jgi:hypothetical protein
MSDLVKLEILEERMLDGANEYVEGDIKSFPAEKAKHWCEMGWARAVNGEFETNERKPGAAPIRPNKVETPVV